MRFLIVDDHPVLREGLSALLRQAFAGATVLQAADAHEALALVTADDGLDAVLLDLNMPGIAGLSAIPEFGRRRPDLPIIVLSSSEDPRHVQAALDQGALGYVPKSASQHSLAAAIRFVLDGDVYVPTFVLKQAAAPAGAPSGAPASISRLTLRQSEILALVIRGEPNKVIAQKLDLSEKTVKVHITAIFKALNVVNRTQAAAVGRDAGLVWREERAPDQNR